MMPRTDKNKTCLLFISVLFVTPAPIWIAYLLGANLFIGFLYGCISIILMFLLPLSISKVFSEYASFDRTILPARKKHYFIIPPVALLLTAVSMFVGHLTHKAGYNMPLKFGSFPIKLLYFVFFSSIVIVPVAEEIFWRGYVLDQLRKYLYPGIALFLHAALFAAYHIPVWGMYCISTFFVGLALGYWRMHHKALLPLIVTHSIVNALHYLPIIAELIRIRIFL